MRRLTALAAVLVTALAVAGVGGASPNSESASGNYEMFGGTWSISLSARATLLHTNASGSFRWIQRNSDPDTVLTADVTCLIVGPARTATVGGVITRFEGPNAFTGVQGIFITVKDNGQGPTAFASDTSSNPVFSATPPTTACTLPFTPSQAPISSGDITVKPALP